MWTALNSLVGDLARDIVGAVPGSAFGQSGTCRRLRRDFIHARCFVLFAHGLSPRRLADLLRLPEPTGPHPPADAVKDYPIAPAYAATEVNATIFRLKALTSDSNSFNTSAYYDPAGQVVVARRHCATAMDNGRCKLNPSSGNVHRRAQRRGAGAFRPTGCCIFLTTTTIKPLHYRQSTGGEDLGGSLVRPWR